jgi:ACDE family multidrug resistance protein
VTDSATGRRLLPLVLAVTSMGVLAFSILAPALPDLAEELGVSRGSIGIVQGAVAAPGIFLASYIGYLADKYGTRRVIRVSLLIFGTAGLSCFLVRDFWPLVGLRVIQGLGTSGLLSLGVVVIGDHFTGLERRWAMGINLAALTATTTLAPIVGGALAEGGAFRPFLIFVLAFPVFLWSGKLPRRADMPLPDPPLRHLRAAMGDLRRRGRLSDFLGMLPMSLLTLGAYLGLGLTVTPLFLEREFSLSVGQRGLVMAIVSAASSTASVMSGRVGRRFAPTQVLTAAFGLIVVGFTIVGTAPNLWQMGAGLAVLGSGTGSIFPLLQDYSAAAGPARYRGVLVGTWVSANRLGQATGPIVGTMLADGIGEREAYGSGAILMTLVALVWLPMRRLAAERPGGRFAERAP